ncbi:hypothetical protein FH972_016701 [Carpinus fangiana]|uniref:Uncharacterized protein n=1 Tax=Carpinus fangiana TaxID=176857 RepID=A0A5N6RK06_9ROSI|nr:hypothetical protein FH972_016701 [Carpinus fangiana]
MAGREYVISVEELPSRKVKVVRTEAGQTNSRGNDADQETQKSKDGTTKQRLEQLEKAGGDNVPNQAETNVPKIQKVTFLLREHKNVAKYFEPRVVSLGPIHHGKSKYQKAEEYKLRLAKAFVKESGEGKTAESLYAEIEKKIKQLREYFDEKVTKVYDDKDLAWMLFVDGCAVLQFIQCAVETKFADMKIKNDQAVFGQQDLFLLENQLPYQLLKDLMKLSEKKEILKKSINSFIDMHATTQTANCKDKQKPAHLLDRLRTRLIGNRESPHITAEQGNKSRSGGQGGQALHSFRNVQELRAAGIQLKLSTTGSLTDVFFSDKSIVYPGYLSLHQITVDDSTGPKLLNLVAYEMCPDFDNEFGVTSYICFLDSLIDHPDDVKELRKAQVLHNLLGSDKEVAKLFNDIATDLVPNPETYADVKQQIQKCYDNKWKTWIAQAIHDHFSSPWTFVGFLAAFLALALTALQTWYSIRGPPSDTRDRSPPATRIPKRY